MLRQLVHALRFYSKLDVVGEHASGVDRAHFTSFWDDTYPTAAIDDFAHVRPAHHEHLEDIGGAYLAKTGLAVDCALGGCRMAQRNLAEHSGQAYGDDRGRRCTSYTWTRCTSSCCSCLRPAAHHGQAQGDALARRPGQALRGGADAHGEPGPADAAGGAAAVVGRVCGAKGTTRSRLRRRRRRSSNTGFCWRRCRRCTQR